MPEFVDVPPLASQALALVSASFAPAGLVGPEWLVSTCLRLDGPLDYGALEGAVTDLARRHDLLRAYLVLEEGRAMVRVPDAAAVDLAIQRPGARAGGDQLAAARALVTAELDRGIDLSRPPGWRIVVVEVWPGVHLLAFVAHHLFVDGWSLELVARDLMDLYRARRGGPAVPGPAASYLAYAAAQQAADRRSAAEWLRSELGGVAPMPTPELRLTRGDRLLLTLVRSRVVVRGGLRLLRTRGLRATLRRRLLEEAPVDPPARRRRRRSERPDRPMVASPPVVVGAEGTERVRALARSLRTTEAVVLGAAVLAAVHRAFGHDDVWAWSLSGGRTSADQLDLVGNFPDVFPIRARFGTGTGPADVVPEVRAALVRFYGAGGFCGPWARPEEALDELLTGLAVDELAPVVDLLLDPKGLRVFYDVSPRAAVEGGAAGGPVTAPAPGDLTWRREELPGVTDRDPAGCQIGVRFTEDGGSLTFTVQYDDRRLPPAAVERFTAALVGAIDDPGAG